MERTCIATISPTGCVQCLAMRSFLRRMYRRFRPAVPPSQGNEQELLARFLSDVEVPRTFCEFGFDGDEFNCARLVVERWHGVLIDGDARKVAAARSLFPPRINVLCEYLYRETIHEIVERHYPRGSLGVLSVDVDGNDYWFLQQLLSLEPGLIFCE